MFIKIHKPLLALTLAKLLIIALANECKHDIVESMPEGLTFIGEHDVKTKPTSDSLLQMIESTKSSLKIASFYVTLSGGNVTHPSVTPGKMILEAIVRAAGRGVKVEVILDKSSAHSMSDPEDVKTLENIATVKFLNMKQLLNNGVMHTKFLVSDHHTFYLGSSNFDWRSYTQIKEIGVGFYDCPILAQDLEKIFEAYVMISDQGKVPDDLPNDLKTMINLDHPLEIELDTDDYKLFLGGSPPAFSGTKQKNGRTDDIDGLLYTINRAWHQVDISVMNYSPSTKFTWPPKFWPRIENALKKAVVERGVHVRLLFSNWTQTNPIEIMWYKSLNEIKTLKLKGGIDVKLFTVPAYDDFQKGVPFARVKHDKYMVTDNGLYVGTSNWTPEYFINTCGVGMVFIPKNPRSNNRLIRNMQNLFERDWSSTYASELV